MKSDVHGIRFRLILAFIGVAVGAVVVLGVLQVGLIRPYYRNSKISSARALASAILDDLLEDSDSGSAEEAFAATVDNDACVVIYNSSGRLVYRADQLGEGCVFNENVTTDAAADYHDFASLQQLVDNSSGEYSTDLTNQETSQEMLVFGVRAEENLATYYLFMNTPLEPVDSLISLFSKQYISLTVIIIIVAAAVSIWLSGKIVRPITDMQKETVKLSKADYDVNFDGGSFTETKDLAAALNHAAGELGKIEDLRRRLMANLSHDIRTPLTNIRAYAEMIRDISGDNKEKREKHLDVIIRETDYMNRLINDMSELSQMQTGNYVLHLSNVDLREKTEEVIEINSTMIQAHALDVIVEMPEHLIVYADETKMTEVIQNFVTNAIRHSEDGSRIWIRGWIKDDEETVHMEVQDEGEGIPEEDLERIWDRYQKASRSFTRASGSTGLGLSIVKAILDTHHAEYGVESKVGEGSTFWFELRETHEG